MEAFDVSVRRVVNADGTVAALWRARSPAMARAAARVDSGTSTDTPRHAEGWVGAADGEERSAPRRVVPASAYAR